MECCCLLPFHMKWSSLSHAKGDNNTLPFRYFWLFIIIFYSVFLCMKLWCSHLRLNPCSWELLMLPGLQTRPVALHFVWEEFPIHLGFFELSSFFTGAAAAATWQYKWVSVSWRLIGGDSLFVEPLARLIPNDTGLLLCSLTSFQHLPISLIVIVIIAAVNFQFEEK